MIKHLAKNGLILTVVLAIGIIFTPAPVIKEKIAIKKITIFDPNLQASHDEKLRNKKLIIDYASAGYGWTGIQSKCLIALWTRESRLDQYAYPSYPNGKRRSTAYGIAQLLGERSSDPSIQILRGLRYLSLRYQLPCRANRHSLRYGWY